MFEKRPTMELGPDKHKELIKGLRDKGIEDVEVKKALETWMIEQERKVDAAGGTREAQLVFELERAKLYAEGGYVDEALDTLYEALYIARQEGKAELEDRIRKEIALLELVE